MGDPKLTLAVASPQQFDYCTRANFSAWGSKLTLEQYIAREKILGELKLYEKHTPWILIRDEDQQIVASCETFCERCLYCYKDELDVREGLSHSVASVFVEDRFRTNRFASEMMTRLNARLRKENAIFSDLYSDVNPRLYERPGWLAFPAPFVEVEAQSFSHLGDRSETEVVLLEEKDVARVCLEDEKRIRDDLLQKAKSISAGVVISHVFTPEKMHWFITRTRWYAEVLGHARPEVFGATLSDGCFISFVPDFPHNSVQVLRLRSCCANHSGELIRTATNEAKTRQLRIVSIWWDLPTDHASHLGLEIKQRENSSIPMLAWFGRDVSQVQWINVEKFGWV